MSKQTMESSSHAVTDWIRTQVQKPEIQQIWTNDVVRPTLESALNVFIKDYLQYVLMICVIWSLLMAIMVVVMGMWVHKSFTT